MASSTRVAGKLKLLLDEMHASSIADAFTESSWDVISVTFEAELRGMSDEKLLGFAAVSGRALVTENVVDFAVLAAQWAGQGRVHAGLIFTNGRRFTRATLAYPGNLITALRRFLEDRPIVGESWTWWL